MMRVLVSTSVVVMLALTYWVSPAMAWVALVATSTILIARRTRLPQNRDENQRAAQAVGQ